MNDIWNLSPTGVVTVRWLRDQGLSEGRLRQLVKTRRLRRLRRGWLAASNADQHVERAVALGGALTGPHALVRSGAWVPPQSKLHIMRLGHRTLSTPPDVHVHASRRPFVTPFGVAPWRTALSHCVRALALPDAVVVADGMLHASRARTLPPLDHIDESLIREALCETGKGSRVEAFTDADSESIIESYPRVWLTLRGYRVRVQFRLHGRERVDIVVEEVIALELDGRHHGEPMQYRKDHAKAARAAVQGLIPLRFSYWQVINEWNLVLEAIETLLARFRPDLLAI